MAAFGRHYFGIKITGTGYSWLPRAGTMVFSRDSAGGTVRQHHTLQPGGAPSLLQCGRDAPESPINKRESSQSEGGTGGIATPKQGRQ